VALAAILALFVMAGYIVGWGVLSYAHGRQLLSDSTVLWCEDTIYFPVRWYTERGLPGTKVLFRFQNRCFMSGIIAADGADMWSVDGNTQD
jgi:hypothetical protein